MELLMRVWDWQAISSAGDLLGPERRHSRTEPPRFLDSESGAAFFMLHSKLVARFFSRQNYAIHCVELR